MKILIIEDDENKSAQIKDLLFKTIKNCKVLLAKSYHSGLQSILSEYPNLILLDMTMPTYDISINEDGGRPQHYAGREILRQMDRRNVNIPVMVITQFDVFGDGPEAMTRTQLDLQLKSNHSKNYCGTIYYNASSNSWKNQLEKFLTERLRKGNIVC